MKELKGRRIARTAFAFPEAEYAAVLGSVACLVASTVVTVDYTFDAHLTDAGRRFHLDAVALLTATAAADVDEHVALATSTCAVRDLMNTRGDVATPQFMQEEAEQLCRQYPSAMELRVVDFEVGAWPRRCALRGRGAEGGFQELLHQRLRAVARAITAVGGAPLGRAKAVGRADRHPKDGAHSLPIFTKCGCH